MNSVASEKAVELPEHIEDYMEHGVARCCAFNRSGTLLATGCEDGTTVVWDFETRGVARILKGHEQPVDCLCWSRNGRMLVTGSSDQWEVLTGRRTALLPIENTISAVSVCRTNSSLAAVSVSIGPPMVVDFEQGARQSIPVAFVEGNLLKWRSNDVANAQNCRALFSKDGRLIFVAAPKATVLVVSAKSLYILDIVKVGGTATILSLDLSPKGQHLLVNSHDRTVRLLKLSAKNIPEDNKDYLPLLREEAAARLTPQQGSLLRSKGLLRVLRVFRNEQDKMQWKGAIFSKCRNYVVAGALSKKEHLLYMWASKGQLVRILQGPPEGIAQLEWHPALSSVLLTVSASSGKIYIWSKIYSENWSAFAPDFRELDQNTEYEEREDEFDVIPEKEVEEVKEEEDDEDVDVVTLSREKCEPDALHQHAFRVQKGAQEAFSSDEEGDFLMHLPVTPKDVLFPVCEQSKPEADANVTCKALPPADLDEALEPPLKAQKL